MRIDCFCIIGKMAGFLSKAYMGRALGALGYPLQEFRSKSIGNGLTFTLDFKIQSVLFSCVRLPYVLTWMIFLSLNPVRRLRQRKGARILPTTLRRGWFKFIESPRNCIYRNDHAERDTSLRAQNCYTTTGPTGAPVVQSGRLCNQDHVR